jgi:hypothetical protein
MYCGSIAASTTSMRLAISKLFVASYIVGSVLLSYIAEVPFGQSVFTVNQVIGYFLSGIIASLLSYRIFFTTKSISWLCWSKSPIFISQYN